MDAREFKQRFMPHHQVLYRVAYHLTGNAQDAEDLLQDMYLKLWQKRDDLPDEAMKEAYLVTMIRHLFVDQRRLKHLDASTELKNEEGPPDERSLDHQIETRLRRWRDSSINYQKGRHESFRCTWWTTAPTRR